MNKINIAIDGPAGAGKSTVARMVAEQLGFTYIDTGAMYRVVTWKALKQRVDVDDESALAELLKETEIGLVQDGLESRVYCDGADRSEQIRAPEVTERVSYVAAHRKIREDLVKRQQALAASGGTVMDGRDIGTAVLPDAKLKVYLTAPVEERARRRYDEQIKKGISTDFDQLKQDIETRDRLDTERDVTPLRQAEDAILLDSTDMSVEEVVSSIISLKNKGDDQLE
ncbi:(d)CMP kinase [Salisediminibacterium selenitireducens]|uniref:Cytidylate kinase n=1 Tax=Bacillus selenitireducens (strain ATCC 700615 / DSM 15326 / MLS10) TaxID=439292 RepID=D6XVB4_BACIE|nr:(d)CMP kinase [Salisediminibacterium selenitireducens]ADH99652.1 cytidylate kinase [[Bacillus] selenitireducens MLS10]